MAVIGPTHAAAWQPPCIRHDRSMTEQATIEDFDRLDIAVAHHHCAEPSATGRAKAGL